MEQKTVSFFSEAALIAFLTAIGYVIAYSFEFGYVTYFKIPSQLIEITIPSIILSWAIVLAVALSTISILIFCLSSIDHNNIIHIQMVVTGFFVFINLCILILFNFDWEECSLLLVPTAIVLIYKWGWPFIRYYKEIGSYGDKVAKLMRNDHPSKNPLPTPQNSIASNTLTLIMGSILLIALSFALGHGFAKQEINFYVFESNQPKVILRIYDDKYICAPIDKRARKIKEQYYIVNASSANLNRSLSLTLEKVGPLTVEE